MSGKRRSSGDGSIYQRASDGLWVASVSVRNPRTGQTQRKPLYARTRSEAQAKLRQVQADVAAGRCVVGDGSTVAKYLGVWLEGLRSNLRETTYLKYEQHIRRRIVPHIGKIRLDRVTALDVQQMINALSATDKARGGGGKLSPVTVADALTVLRHAFSDAERAALMPRNVAALVDKPRQTKKEMDCFTPDEARRFLLSVAGQRLEALYTVAISLGLRRGEALGLMWTDIDLSKRTLSVHRTLVPINGRLELLEPKTPAAYRTITLPSTTVHALERHRERQDAERDKAGADWQERGLVFSNQSGGLMQPRNFNRDFNLALKRAGLPHICVHGLRHTACSLLLAAGMSVKAVSEMMGHSSIQITLDLYGHVYDETRRELADAIDKIYTPNVEGS